MGAEKRSRKNKTQEKSGGGGGQKGSKNMTIYCRSKLNDELWMMANTVAHTIMWRCNNIHFPWQVHGSIFFPLALSIHSAVPHALVLLIENGRLCARCNFHERWLTVNTFTELPTQTIELHQPFRRQKRCPPSSSPISDGASPSTDWNHVSTFSTHLTWITRRNCAQSGKNNARHIWLWCLSSFSRHFQCGYWMKEEE